MFDNKDKRILSELLLDARISLTKLAKRTQVSREVVAYRIKRLEEQKTIQGYYALINYTALGYSRQVIFLAFKGVTAEQEANIILHLAQHEYVTYMSTIIGKWNVVLDIVTENQVLLEKVFHEILQPIEKHLSNFLLINTTIRGEFYPTKFLGITTKHNVPSETKYYELDAVDKQLLQELSTNARAEYTMLAKTTGLPATTVAFRIKRLQKNNILLGSTMSIDYKQFGWDFYNIQLKMQQKQIKKFFSFVSEHPNTVFYYEYLGHESWDLDVGIIVQNTQELQRVVNEIKEKFGDELRIQNMYAIGTLIKDNMIPPGILK